MAMYQRRIGLLVVGLFACASPAAAALPAATLEIQGDPLQPANAPVLLELVVRNTGTTPISYWCAGPGDYPDARDFAAIVFSARPRGPLIPTDLSNGQSDEAAGKAFEVVPGRTIRFPVAMPPLPPGEYDIKVACGFDGRMQGRIMKVVTWPAMRSASALHLSVRDDKQLIAVRDVSIVAKVREHDPFARHVASTWPRLSVRRELEKDLAGDDIVAADRAADGLWGDGAPAANDGPLVARVILKHLDPPKDGACDTGLMSKLMRREGDKPVESGEVRDAVAKLALARGDGRVHDGATEALGLGRGSVSNETVQTVLARLQGVTPPPSDSPYLDALLGLARSADPAERKVAYRRLADFQGDRAAVDAARAGLLDDDAECRREASETYTRLNRLPQPPVSP